MVAARQKKVREINSSYINNQERHEDLRAKRRRGLVRRLTALSIFVTIIAVFAIVTIHSQASILHEKEQELMHLEEQLVGLQLIERDLYTEIENYNDLEYIAEIARRDYFLSKPGETIFKLPPSSSD
ncbi:FtsB family cell division protein [Anaerobacillus sp. MEB173]|uniref:FtsB family cell division protein n=1 Tax=Anaerobacillus sp. MEB173 TaxID=3383345 RepID=UPI003F8E4CD1